MNRFDSQMGGEARLRYLDADYDVLAPGSFVTCAVTGERISLDELRYWSVDRQEPYATAEAVVKRDLGLA
ncbi:Exodeoxyribonuclease VII small subunit (EC 3.1.11.6) [Candidatus Phaeomarinobacter ectocarpi]|uniref:Exodeoxyribonuclease VII small subunit n=2 Tax=Candidatus Phaeomarinibacter ectocarpi TaxID=1458461 RepID=X5M9S1_9HYPH|nr:Exodeoxyribonuclease VII small subunit (EC 3.1.11.6) [Candidatus Phaeomarinobacter ectocarpi]